jgi:hypothetical protein
MIAEVSLKFLELNVDAKANYGDDRVADMTGKPEFGDMAAHGIVLADWTLAGTNLRAGILAANGGNQAQKDALSPLEKAWNRIGKKVAKYVTEKASEKDTVDEQIAIINVSGFDYNKVTRTESEAPGQTENFSMSPVPNIAGRSKIKSNSVGSEATYISIFHTDPNLLDQISYNNNQLTLPPTTQPFVIHTTSDSRETEVDLTSGIKWHGLRFAVNRKGRGPNSNKASVIPQ